MTLPKYRYSWPEDFEREYDVFSNQEARQQRDYAAALERSRNMPAPRVMDEDKITSWETFLSLFRYKPGFAVQYFDDIEYNRGRVIIQMIVEDTYRRGILSEVRNIFYVPRKFPGLYHAQGQLHCEIQKLEMHEADEWFMVNGKRPYDPHIPLSLEPK